MNPDQNKAVLAAVFAETAKGNGRPFIDALAEDVQWTIIGTTPWSKTYVGKGSVINELLRPLGEQLGGASVQATGHNATVRGERYENTYCWIIRMHEGKMRELTEYADTQLIESVLRDPHSSK
jgi:ketosteroid isomerase-like protein